jgi:hypothetical protein
MLPLSFVGHKFGMKIMWECFFHRVRIRVMVFNAIFNNISVTSWWSVLLVEDPEKTTDLLQVTGKPYDIMLYQVHVA